MTSVEIDLRVGGRWRYVMTANEGFEVAFHGEYREIVPDERMVCTEVFEGVPNGADRRWPPIRSPSATGGPTDRCSASTPASSVRDMIIDSGMEGGMQEALDQLEQVAISLA